MLLQFRGSYRTGITGCRCEQWMTWGPGGQDCGGHSPADCVWPQVVKNLPTMQETQVPSLDQEDILEKGMATRSSVLAWEMLWTEEPGGLQSMGSQKSQT